ncbi:MAG: tRNA (adenosine(37)-N6)-threonylcarbamoyltransferase complex ATPase subunit type 1 TsaE [Chlamydiae bacterium]|nr:tRNA (adenosine(37)-N6)-threonylcarbamoyltransferase complex ATPase subunit type 1 TsaE [Chlamydiota bacterium]
MITSNQIPNYVELARYYTPNVELVSSIAKTLLSYVKPGVLITLSGPLGAGKTTLIKELISDLAGISLHQISSPTFTYMNIFHAPTPIHHFDLYRLSSAAQIDGLGLSDYMYDKNSIKIVEWAEKVPELLLENRIHIEIIYLGPTEREYIIKKYEKN